MLGNIGVGGQAATEDETAGWHHRLDGREFEQALGDSEGQGGLACCSPWGCKGSGMTQQLNNTNSKTPRNSTGENQDDLDKGNGFSDIAPMV